MMLAPACGRNEEAGRQAYQPVLIWLELQLAFFDLSLFPGYIMWYQPSVCKAGPIGSTSTYPCMYMIMCDMHNTNTNYRP